MATSADARAKIIDRLLRDIEATLGSGFRNAVLKRAAELDSFIDEPNWYCDNLVEDVQQEFHDCFVDVTWPACPRHPNHPLWLHREFESWWCESDAVAIARLGELGSALRRNII
jgi:hypothetical protein